MIVPICPKCEKLGWDDAKKVIMEEVGIVSEDCCPEGCCCTYTKLYQCPECKTVVIQ